MQGALTRYRIIAWIVGVVLIVLVLVGMPLKYLADNDAVVAAVGPAHGFLFIVYVLATFDLGRRLRWPHAGRHDSVPVLLRGAQSFPF